MASLLLLFQHIGLGFTTKEFIIIFSFLQNIFHCDSFLKESGLHYASRSALLCMIFSYKHAKMFSRY